MTTVLVIEDEPGLRQGLCEVLKAMGLNAVAAAGIAEGRRALAAEAIDCVLLDIRLRDGDGLDFLRELRAGPSRDVPVIVTTAYGDSERTIRAMRDGAFDYVTKPFDLPVLQAAVTRATKQRALARTAVPAPVAEAGAGDLVGTSAAMLGVWKAIGRAAGSSAPVLITGETGTGKELVARAIHAYSARADQPFEAVNLAALPATLIESELFGHERGAFTGATGRRAGRFETALAGTLFLDEIGDLDPALQTKLLRTAQGSDGGGAGTFQRVGGNELLSSRARIIAATNRPVRPGAPGVTLREDLYYRLAVIEIEVPPLRARRSDIPLLVSHVLRGTPARAVSEEAMARLLAYGWPGNVRELFHVLQRAAVMGGGEIIDAVSLPESPRAEDSVGKEPSPWPSPASGRGDNDDDLSLHAAVARVERQLIVRALDRAKGNRSAAARLLGIGRPLLYAKLVEHQIAPRAAETPDPENSGD